MRLARVRGGVPVVGAGAAERPKQLITAVHWEGNV